MPTGIKKTYKKRRTPGWVPYSQWKARQTRSRRRSNYKRRTYNNGKSGWTPIIKAIAPAIGAAAGSLLGPAGTAIGGAAGSLASLGAMSLMNKFSGFGDYEIAYNTILKPDSVPQYSGQGRNFIISHREYIQDIISGPSGTFNLDSFVINPADSGTFPWLSEIAEQFEQYRIHGMIFEFKSNSADALNSTNTALGQVIMATQYNVLLPVFTNKQAMENYQFGSSTKPSQNLVHPIECDPKLTPFGPWFNTRIGGSVSTGDDRLYDLARFSIATNGMQASNVNVGELWCSYQIEFSLPRMSNPDFAVHYQLGGLAGTVTSSDLFSDAVLSSTSDDIDIDITTTANTIVIPNWYSGNIAVTYFAAGTTGATCVDPSMTPLGGATPLYILNDNSFFGQKSNYAAATTAMDTTSFFKCVNGGIIELSAATLPTGVVIGDLIIATIPSTLLN